MTLQRLPAKGYPHLRDAKLNIRQLVRQVEAVTDAKEMMESLGDVEIRFTERLTLGERYELSQWLDQLPRYHVNRGKWIVLFKLSIGSPGHRVVVRIF